MRTVKFEITNEQAKRWEAMLGDYFAGKSKGKQLGEAYRDAGLKAEAAMSQEAE